MSNNNLFANIKPIYKKILKNFKLFFIGKFNKINNTLYDQDSLI
jgi:hypothetical protein